MDQRRAGPQDPLVHHARDPDRPAGRERDPEARARGAPQRAHQGGDRRGAAADRGLRRCPGGELGLRRGPPRPRRPVVNVPPHPLDPS